MQMCARTCGAVIPNTTGPRIPWKPKQPAVSVGGLDAGRLNPPSFPGNVSQGARTSPMLLSRNREKLINVIVFFASNTEHCGKVKLFKLLYLLDFAHFRQTGRS